MRPVVTIFEGEFWTAAERPRGGAVAVDDLGLIAAVEPDGARIAAAFPLAARIRLPKGSLGVPAFHDAHNHWGFAAFDHAAFLGDCHSVEGLLSRLNERAETSTEGWILGYGWNTGQTGDLTQADLDRVSNKRPVAVFDKSTHAVQLNAAAVNEIGPAFERSKAEGHRGWLEGGRLLEMSFLVFGAMRLPDAALQRSLIELEQKYLAHGIASLDDMDVLSPQILDSLHSLYVERRLTLPCHAFIDFGRFRDALLPEPRSHGAFNIVGMKSYMDGALGARSAGMYEPFLGTGGHGVMLLDCERFKQRRDLAFERGYRHLALHAIGDRAVAEAVELLEGATLPKGDFDRLRIEHFQFASDEDRERCADAGIAICMQPNFTSDVADYADRLGDRAKKLCEHRAALDSGALLGFGSDGMPTGPLHGLRCAVEHPIEAQRLSVIEALRAYSIDACRISLTDDRRGSLEVGKEANLTVLSRDIVREKCIAADVKVLATIVSSRIAYRAEPGVLPSLTDGRV